MANATPIQLAVAKGVIKTTWTITAANDTGLPECAPQFPVKTVTMTGTWNAGTILLEGSNDGTTYVTLNDPNGNALSFTADKTEAVLENPLYVRPRASVAVTSVVVTLVSQGDV